MTTANPDAGATGLTPRAVQSTLLTAQGDAMARWRAWVTDHAIGSSLLAGAVATQLATVFGIWFRGFGLPTLSWPAVNGAIAVPTASTGAQFAIGEFTHTIDGIVFALLFALLVHPRIPLRNNTLGNLGKGMIYGTALAILSAAWWVPYVAFPHSGAGVFSTGFGWKLVFGIFLWHWIYGYFLGTIYNPLPADESARR